MTHRIDHQASERLATILFQGLLDRPALAALESRCRELGRDGGEVRVRLAASTKVVVGVLEELVRLEGITLEAESPFLTRWIQSCMSPGVHRP